jgi:aldehyde dehydrogenase (NAD+)
MEFLKELGIEATNPGAFFGNGEWSTTQDKGVIESVNPANGELVANVYGASPDDYERIMRKPCANTKARLAAWSPLKWAKSRLKVTEKFRK